MRKRKEEEEFSPRDQLNLTLLDMFLTRHMSVLTPTIPLMNRVSVEYKGDTDMLMIKDLSLLINIV